jgi:ABC-type glutathione transport system ATPase component
MAALLQIANLRVTYPGAVSPLVGVALEVAAGEAVGVFGPSGAGKSTLLRSIPRLLPAGTRIEGTIRFDGMELLDQPESAMRRLRGRRVAYIPQAPAEALNPVLPVETQVAEVLRVHFPMARTALRAAVMERLVRYFPENAARIARAYPHELSGGERQRVVICQVLCASPSLLLADEPTSALDSVAQLDFLRLLRQTQEQTGMSLIFVSHDRAVLRFVTTRQVSL